MLFKSGAIAFAIVWLILCFQSNKTGVARQPNRNQPDGRIVFENERHLRNVKQLTFGGENAEAYFSFDGGELIFLSNLNNPRGRNFDLYLIGVDGKNLERVTFSETFDGFPMFSPDNKKLVFASNRNAAQRGDTNVFIADWIE